MAPKSYALLKAFAAVIDLVREIIDDFWHPLM